MGEAVALRRQLFEGGGTLVFRQAILDFRPALLDRAQALGIGRFKGPGERRGGEQAEQEQAFHFRDSLALASL